MLSAPVNVSLIALMTSEPFSTCAFALRLVYVSSSLLPQPFPPRSKDHLVESTADPVGPLNSSLHASLHPAGLPADAVEDLRGAEPQMIAKSRRVSVPMPFLAVSSSFP